MSTDELTITEQLDRAHESAREWRRAHDRQLQRTVAEQAKTKAAERKAQLLQAKLDGTAMARGEVLADLCDNALTLLGGWLDAAVLSETDNVYTIEWRKGVALRGQTRDLLTKPRYPK